MTPRSVARRPNDQVSVDDRAKQQLSNELADVAAAAESDEKIHLNDFLQLAGIKFMDLTTTKRRHTIAPTPAKSKRGVEGDAFGSGNNAAEKIMEEAVVTGACTIPELDLYQHSCRELKRYISEGKAFLKTLENDVYADGPPLIRAYTSATEDRKVKLDVYLRDAKTQARLRSKEIWYGWRSQLLQGLDDGLQTIKKGLEDDSDLLAEKAALLAGVLPDMLESQQSMELEAERLQKAARAMPEKDRAMLTSARDELTGLNATLPEKKQLLEDLETDLVEQQRFAEVYVEAKVENLAAIEEAERVGEACRGWTIDEVSNVKGMSRITDLDIVQC